MDKTIPKYKLVALRPVDKSLALDFWNNSIFEVSVSEKYSLKLNDDSILIFHSSRTEDQVFVEFQCQLAVVAKNSVSFGLLSKFIKFCQKYDAKIRVLHNKSEIEPSFGAVFSDLKWSLPFKKASRLAENSNEIK